MNKLRTVYWCEIKRKRPAVTVSNNASNKFLNRVQVIPLASKIERIYPSEAFINLNGEKRKAMADQITTVSKLRILEQSGVLSNSDMNKIREAIKIQLNLV